MQPCKIRYVRASAGLRRRAVPAAALLATLLLAGCQSQPTYDALAANDYRLRHPITVREAPQTMDLPIGTGSRQLSPQMAAAISSFGGDARAQGGGTVEIVAPSGSANEAAVHALLPQIRKALVRGGVARKRIITRSYPVHDTEVAAPVRLAYMTMRATAGPCGQWPDNITGGSPTKHNPQLNNTLYSNFGCSAQANLAAMVENPADLLYPRASAPGDQMRRGTVYEKYRKGEKTASDYKEGDGAQISDAVGN
ncbi:CpaD family pilus assembly protein [Stappia indica]|uniref:CpaD family pilus assembly protein n=1 Tax=Stappia indica TaxID=538381 RepID=UPI001CD7F3DD|nr:CpaD family pilus assembly protein [Stappia indica]MCA1300793.1 CpaD family pilus assembly protein [Stappia indica]